MQSPAHALNTLARTFRLCPMSSLIPVTNFLEVQILGLQNAACSVRNPTMCQIKGQRKASRVGHIYKCQFVRIEIIACKISYILKGFQINSTLLL